MKVRCIIAQRKCRYPGQYAPELLDAWSEYVFEDNPEGYAERLDEEQKRVGTEYEAVRELDIVVPDTAIDALFLVPEVDAVVVETEGNQ